MNHARHHEAILFHCHGGIEFVELNVVRTDCLMSCLVVCCDDHLGDTRSPDAASVQCRTLAHRGQCASARHCCIGRCSFDHETLNRSSHLDNWRWTRSDLSGRPLLAILRQAAHGWWIRSGGSAKARVRACAGSSVVLWGIRPGRAGQVGTHKHAQDAYSAED